MISGGQKPLIQALKDQDNKDARDEFDDKIESKQTQYKELSNPVNFDQKVNQQQQVLTSAISGITQGDTNLVQAIANFQNANLKMEEGDLEAALQLIQSNQTLISNARDNYSAEIKAALSETDQIVQRYAQYIQAYYAAFKVSFNN